jgi:hypothetical protein
MSSSCAVMMPRAFSSSMVTSVPPISLGLNQSPLHHMIMNGTPR